MLCYLNDLDSSCKQVLKNIWCPFSFVVDNNSLELKTVTPQVVAQLFT